jgi:hypothetical protein
MRCAKRCGPNTGRRESGIGTPGNLTAHLDKSYLLQDDPDRHYKMLKEFSPPYTMEKGLAALAKT